MGIDHSRIASKHLTQNLHTVSWQTFRGGCSRIVMKFRSFAWFTQQTTCGHLEKLALTWFLALSTPDAAVDLAGQPRQRLNFSRCPWFVSTLIPRFQERCHPFDPYTRWHEVVTARKDDAAAVQAAIVNVAGLNSSSAGGGLIQTTSG